MSSIGLEATAQADATGKPSAYRYYVLFALLVVYTLNFLDRQFLSVLAEPVKTSLHLSDTQMGALTGPVFALFYTVIGIPVGMLADRFNRVRIVSVASALWSLFTAACGFATSFLTLAIPRMGVGIGEAGGAPPSYSIVSDYFPPRQRGTALAVFSLGVPLGSMFGAMSGGFIAAHFGWQAAFKALGVVGLLISPIFFFTVKEPKRGHYDTVAIDGEPPIGPVNPFSAIVVFLTRPMLWLTAVSAGLSAFVGYGMLNWIPALLIRDKGMTLSEIGLYYALSSGLTMALGTWASGYIVDKLGPKYPRAYAMVPGVSILLSLPFLFMAVHAPSWPMALLWLVGPSILNITYLAPALAVIQNAVPGYQRVTAGALLLFLLNLIGLGGGPLFVGFMSDHFKPQYGAAKALEMGLLSLAPFFVLAFLVQMLAGHFIARSAKAAKAVAP